jgi:hypothetical protein
MTQAINLANFSNSLDSSGGVPPTQLNAPVPVSKGGTGASTASVARTNLGSTTVGDAVFIATSTANARSAIGAVIGTDIPSPTGTGASGTWGINVTGNAATAASCTGNSATATALTGSAIRSGTVVASTSGTSIDFTSIPSWVKRITVMFNGVSTSGTSNYLIQIGSGSVQTTGYVSGSEIGTTSAISTVGMIFQAGSAGLAWSGIFTFASFGSNTWISGHSTARSSDGGSNTGGGTVTLSGALDRVRITTVNGTDTFDAGSINILYE